MDGVVGTVGGVLGGPATAQADPVQHLLAGINSVRAGVGVGPVTLDPVVSLVAQAWALVMATAGEISHNPNVGDQLNGIVAVAENVGRGPSLDWIHNGLINSPSHYKNMVNPNYTVVGLGVLTLGSQTWVVEDFVRPLGGEVSTPPPMLSPDSEAGAAPLPPETRTTTPPTTAARPRLSRQPPRRPRPSPSRRPLPLRPSPPSGSRPVLDGLSLLDRLSV